MTISDISELCAVDEPAVDTALADLESNLEDRGISVIRQDDTVQLVTAQEFSDLIASVKEQEVNTDLTEAQSEALAVIAYLSPVRKIKIDFIRGVNSRAVLRNLSTRGLITKKRLDGKAVYDLTTDALAHLGITNIEELPDYESTRSQLLDFIESDAAASQMDNSEN